MSLQTKLIIFFGLIFLSLILFTFSYLLHKKNNKRIKKDKKKLGDFWNKLSNVSIFSIGILGLSSIASSIFVVAQ